MRTALRWLCRFAALLGFLQILVTVTPVLRWWNAALSSPWGANDGDILIVLGSDSLGPGIPGLGSWWRSFYAVRVWREGHFHRMIVTGRDVAGAMRDYMAAEGVPRQTISVENAATSTRENAVFVANLLRANTGRLVLLTSDYHSGRALAAFRKAGLQLTALPFPDAGKRVNFLPGRWDVFCTLAVETVKSIYYKARGWT